MSLRSILVVAAMTAVGVSAGSRWWHRGEPPRLPLDGKLAVQWIGHQFPLLDDSHNVDLRQGKWLVFFVHSHCSPCKAMLPELVMLTNSLRAGSNPGAPRVAVIDCDRKYADDPNLIQSEDLASEPVMLHTRKIEFRGPVTMLVNRGIVDHVFDNPRNIALMYELWVPGN